MKNKHVFGLVSMLVSLSFVFPPVVPPAQAQVSTTRSIVFPVIGTVSYSDDFGAPRSGGRSHEGNDILGKKLMPLVAAVDGTLTTVVYPEASWGYSVSIRDKDGYRYNYLHINNDNPGTDDGQGGGGHAYGPDIMRGLKVVKGQFIGWMGDSGNAESTTAHLHFEIVTPDGTPINPYQSLRNASRITEPASYPALDGEILPFGDFNAGASLALGNFDKDSNLEIATGARAGGGPLVRTFETTGKNLESWYAFDTSFTGGVDVATGDIDDDGKDDIVVGAGLGGSPQVKVYKADGETVLAEFLAYDVSFRGGVNVSSADIVGGDEAEIITSPASAGGPHVKVFDRTGKVLKEFMAYDPNFTAGIDVAAAKGRSEAVIVTAPNAGGGPHIKLFNEDGELQEELMAYDGNFHGGVRVAASVSGSRSNPMVHVIPASGGGPHYRTISASGSLSNGSLVSFEPWWSGGYDVAASGSTVYVVSVGGRRTSIRSIKFSASGDDDERPSRRRRSSSSN